MAGTVLTTHQAPILPPIITDKDSVMTVMPVPVLNGVTEVIADTSVPDPIMTDPLPPENQILMPLEKTSETEGMTHSKSEALASNVTHILASVQLGMPPTLLEGLTTSIDPTYNLADEEMNENDAFEEVLSEIDSTC